MAPSRASTGRSTALPAAFDSFTEIWLQDFEFCQPDGHVPDPTCAVFIEYRTGREVRLNYEELRTGECPVDVGASALHVAYNMVAEASCYLALGWRLPQRVLDLYVEYRRINNRADGQPPRHGYGLLGCLEHFRLHAMDTGDKQTMRELAMRGGPWSAEEQRALLDYCAEDVYALDRLLPVISGPLLAPLKAEDTSERQLVRALHRGRYMLSVARMERDGVPFDAELYGRLLRNWAAIQERLVSEIDAGYGVFEGTTFKRDRFQAWLRAAGIPWPRLPSGVLALDDDTFRQQARVHAEVAPLRELRVAMAQMRRGAITFGPDSRNRTSLWPFGSRTSRNQPSNSKFVFGQAVWLRSLIRPEPGTALAYIDYGQQEFAIAAALSGDANMLAAYTSGDPYLEFAKQAGAVPPDGTKQSHGAERDKFKICALGVLYGMGPDAIAERIGMARCDGERLLRLHRQTYPVFNRWSMQQVSNAGSRTGEYEPSTIYGWSLKVRKSDFRPTAIRNFPIQATGAEMLRLAIIKAHDMGVRVAAPVHDALLIEAPIEAFETAIATTREAMRLASLAVLRGVVEVGTDVERIQSGQRYTDKRGQHMFETVLSVLDQTEQLELF